MYIFRQSIERRTAISISCSQMHRVIRDEECLLKEVAGGPNLLLYYPCWAFREERMNIRIHRTMSGHAGANSNDNVLFTLMC